MLNRRTLRIKAMQAIFAYKQSKEANFELAKSNIQEAFSPDLNSMEVQDRDLLRAQSKEALKIFSSNYKNEDFSCKESETERINEVIQDALRDYYAANDKDFKAHRKTMLAEAEKIQDRYLLVLNLIIEFRNLAESDQKIDHSNFVKNLLIRAFESSESLENASLRKNLKWSADLVRQWFRDIIKKDETYLNYISKKATFEEDRDIVNHIVKNIIFKNEVIGKFMEEENINWDEDRAIIKSLVTKTLKTIDIDGGSLDLQELSYNWDDDKEFFKKLYVQTIPIGPEYAELIDKNTRNWDIERIAATDKIIIEMAIGEMINFNSIPVKVTINEYIEVAKKYSTPKSKLFINGVLDVISKELIEAGKIRKSGRGLIDNK